MPNNFRDEGLCFVKSHLETQGWIVEEAQSKTSEYDFELQSYDGTKRIRVKIKTLQGNDPVPFNDRLDKMKGDFWIVVNNLNNVEKEPSVYILSPEEVERLVHTSKSTSEQDKKSCWLQHKDYDKDEFRDRWERLGLPNL